GSLGPRMGARDPGAGGNQPGAWTTCRSRLTWPIVLAASTDALARAGSAARAGRPTPAGDVTAVRNILRRPASVAHAATATSARPRSPKGSASGATAPDLVP